ncbi:uncharacterized protein [Parasteatoda tepidariorum]|uniref:uncharacterized protein n=1 Tax=Parasteatoda tepidariorum TaxID=114398 RepID=UPI00077F8BF9|nr:uncharacterized protein LOC107450400 [Parasteatoda tepidariorum]
MLSLFCLVLVCGGALAAPSGNQYMDNVLHTTLQNVIKSEKLDPTHLPDYTFEYTDKIFFTKVHGKAEYSEGSLSGLSQVIRISECQGPTNISSVTVINCTLSFNMLQTSYKGRVKYGVLPKVTIDANGNTSNAIVDVSVSKALHDSKATLRSYKVRQVRRLDTHFTGLGPLNKQMKVLEENYKGRVTQEVINVVQNRFQYALNLAVGQVPMPLR